MEIKRYQKIIYIIIVAVSIIWCAGILIAPLWSSESGLRGSASDFFYSFYAKSCHQLDSRSFHIGEHKLGVCSRCTSIYFGFLLGVLVYPFVRKLNNIDLPSLLYLFVGVVLLVIDVGLDLLDIFKNTFFTREITGSVIGVILPFYIIPGTIRVFYEYFMPPKVIPKK